MQATIDSLILLSGLGMILLFLYVKNSKLALPFCAVHTVTAFIGFLLTLTKIIYELW